MSTDLRQAAMATTFADRTRVILVTSTCCVIALIGAVMGMSWLFAGPSARPFSCGPGGVWHTIVDSKPDGSPYLTIVCRDGRSWMSSR